MGLVDYLLRYRSTARGFGFLMYTRKELSKLLGISVSSLRRLLKKFNVKPVCIQTTDKQLPLYLYSQYQVAQLQEALKKAYAEYTQKKKRCCICKQRFTLAEMIGTRCIQCYVQRHCKPLIYGSNVWQKLVNNKIVDKALKYLARFKSDPK